MSTAVARKFYVKQFFDVCHSLLWPICVLSDLFYNKNVYKYMNTKIHDFCDACTQSLHVAEYMHQRLGG